MVARVPLSENRKIGLPELVWGGAAGSEKTALGGPQQGTPAYSQVHQPAPRHSCHPAPESTGGPGGAAPSGWSQCLGPT